jgi:hypothetical protein
MIDLNHRVDVCLPQWCQQLKHAQQQKSRPDVRVMCEAKWIGRGVEGFPGCVSLKIITTTSLPMWRFLSS